MLLFIRILFRNMITHSRLVFVFGLIVILFVSGEPTYDDFHAGDEET